MGGRYLRRGRNLLAPTCIRPLLGHTRSVATGAPAPRVKLTHYPAASARSTPRMSAPRAAVRARSSLSGKRLDVPPRSTAEALRCAIRWHSEVTPHLVEGEGARRSVPRSRPGRGTREGRRCALGVDGTGARDGVVTLRPRGPRARVAIRGQESPGAHLARAERTGGAGPLGR
jgi:hypothetical protein